MTLAELNAKDREGFVSAIAGAFEESPWVAQRAWEKRPFATLDALSDAMASVVAGAPREEQLSLLRAHAELGAVRLKPDTTGTVLQADRTSPESQREQAGAGLGALTPGEFERLRALNSAYREKFGFPFVYAVKGRTKHEILEAIERRLKSTQDAEHHEALRQVYRIARFRLEDMLGQERL
jgi:2-oxo-4-hydroxy-4-carboxy-5-ureidoimidazoline decarboxylase